MANSTIETTLGLSSKNFKSDLGLAQGMVKKFAWNAKKDLDSVDKRAGTLGRTFSGIGKSLMAGLGIGSAAAVARSIQGAISKSKELDEAINKALSPAPKYGGVEELKAKIEELKKASDDVESHVSSTWQSSIGEISSRFGKLVEVALNPKDAWNGKIALHEPDSKKRERQKAEINRERKAREEEMAAIEELNIAAKWREQNVGEHSAKVEAMERSQKQQLMKTAAEYGRNSLQVKNLVKSHEMERAALDKKYNRLHEDLDLRERVAAFQGKEDERRIFALEEEIRLLKKRRNEAGTPLEEKRNIDVQITEKTTQLKAEQDSKEEAEVKERARRLDQTPQEREAERLEKQKQARLERTARANIKDEQDRAARQSYDPFAAHMERNEGEASRPERPAIQRPDGFKFGVHPKRDAAPGEATVEVQNAPASDTAITPSGGALTADSITSAIDASQMAKTIQSITANR